VRRGHTVTLLASGNTAADPVASIPRALRVRLGPRWAANSPRHEELAQRDWEAEQRDRVPEDCPDCHRLIVARGEPTTGQAHVTVLPRVVRRLGARLETVITDGDEVCRNDHDVAPARSERVVASLAVPVLADGQLEGTQSTARRSRSRMATRTRWPTGPRMHF
jgi:hypothetical protein